MADLQVAMSRQAPEAGSLPVKNLEQLSERRAARIVHSRLYYI